MSGTVLPAELLGEIFLSIIVKIHSESAPRPLHTSTIRTAVYISSVDTYWRLVALSTPKMWSYVILIHHSGAWQTHPDLLALVLARAQSVPLNLQIKAVQVLYQESASAWDALAERLMAATAFLEIIATTNVDDELHIADKKSLGRILIKPSPKLKSLKLSLRSYNGLRYSKEVGSQILPYAPLLVELELEHVGALRLDMILPETIRGLWRLSWHVAEQGLSVADVLHAAPNLQYFELGHGTLRESSNAATHLHIARYLVSIRGDINTIVSQLDRTRLPNIETIHFSDDPDNFDATDIARFFDSTSYMSLQHLVLPFVDHRNLVQLAQVIQLFKYTPNIQTLSLPRPLEKDGYLAEWTQPENVRLLPKLQKIIFRRVFPFELTMVERLDNDTVSTFFQTRQAAMLDICDSDRRLPLELEIEFKNDTAAIEEICDLLSPYVATIRVVGSWEHRPLGTVLLEVRNGMRQVRPS